MLCKLITKVKTSLPLRPASPGSGSPTRGSPPRPRPPPPPPPSRTRSALPPAPPPTQCHSKHKDHQPIHSKEVLKSHLC